jgi:hypothetical protein
VRSNKLELNKQVICILVLMFPKLTNVVVRVAFKLNRLCNIIVYPQR